MSLSVVLIIAILIAVLMLLLHIFHSFHTRSNYNAGNAAASDIPGPKDEATPLAVPKTDASFPHPPQAATHPPKPFTHPIQPLQPSQTCCQYSGATVNGQKEGQGTCVWPDGRYYTGGWAHDTMEGYGVLHEANGRMCEGDFRDGMMEGRGWCTYADGRRYEGEWLGDAAHGTGVLTYPSGEKHEGEFRGGSIQGKGIHTWPDGRREWGRTSTDKNGVLQFRGVPLDDVEKSKVQIVVGDRSKGNGGEEKGKGKPEMEGEKDEATKEIKGEGERGQEKDGNGGKIKYATEEEMIKIFGDKETLEFVADLVHEMNK